MGRLDHVQRLIRHRSVRLGIAVALIGLSFWAFLPYLGYRISSSAFVNAELVRVSAPIAGRLTRELPRKGDYIEHTHTVTLIRALSPDQRHLLGLVSRQAGAVDRAILARSQLQETATADQELEQRTRIFRDGMIARLEFEISGTEAERTGCVAEADYRRDISSRIEELVKTGVASSIRSAETLAVMRAALTRCDVTDEKLKRLNIEIGAARNGVMLGDGANDAPYSQQQRDRLVQRRQELETKIQDETSQSNELESELAAERSRFEQLSRFDLSLPGQHVVWSVAASPGSTVSEGQILLDLAACNRRFVAVDLPGRDFEDIKAGAPAFVRLIGSSDWTQGEILQVRGSAARTDDRLLAAQVIKPDPSSITVEIGLARIDDQSDHKNFCNIGRLAEVRFQRTGFGFFDSVGRLFGRLVSYAGYTATPGQ